MSTLKLRPVLLVPLLLLAAGQAMAAPPPQTGRSAADHRNADGHRVERPDRVQTTPARHKHQVHHVDSKGHQSHKS